MSGLDEVVAGQHVQERDERDDHGNAPRESSDQTAVAATKQQADPDQHHGDRVRMQSSTSTTFFSTVSPLR
jgi:hypothetical protein